MPVAIEVDTPTQAAPPLGHHTTEVLQSHLGLSAQTIEQLRAEGVL